MKLILSTLLLCGVACSQTPTNEPKPVPAPVPAPVKQEPVKQEPKPANGATEKPKVEPKQEPKVEPKPAIDPKTGKPVVEPKTDKPVEPPAGEGVIERPASDQPMPKGTDPADLALLRSQEQMQEVERKLVEQMKTGKLVGLDKLLPFDELSSWPYEDGLKGMPKRVKELSGKKVLMTGFMLPIDEVQNIKEFLLVQSLWSCCYGQPPDIHGIVRVVMPKGKTTDYFFDPLKITGTFKVEATILDGYCVDIYQLHVDSLEAIKLK